jgi:NTE family protein
MTSRRSVALVVGSGGLKCVSSLGLWRALVRENIDVELAVGCSGGSIYAAAIALGWSVEDAIQASYELWRDRFRKRNVRALFQIALPKWFGFDHDFALIDDTGVNESLMTGFGDARIEDAKIPLHIVATDLANGERVILSKGLVFDAVRASIAIPLALRSWPVDGRRLMDGGASDPLPVDVAIREGAQVILAMGFENAYLKEIDAVQKLVLQASTVATNALLRSTYAFYSMAHHAEVIPVMPAIDRRVGLSDTHLIPYLIEQGEAAAEREMPYLRRLLETETPITA